ncbi:MAG: hypothetical protein IKE36_00660 [Solobacterium sp.]|nr:hypothetical protein [Solobacterium sp.]
MEKEYDSIEKYYDIIFRGRAAAGEPLPVPGVLRNLDTFHHMNKKNEPTGAHDYKIYEYLKENRNIFILGQIPYFYTGGVFKADPEGTKLKTEIKALIYPEFIKSSTIERIYKLFLQDEELKETPETINNYPVYWINFLNGFYDPVKREMVPHDPKYKAVNQIPHEYNQGERIKSNLIDKWLDFITPEPESREMLLQYIGYCMTRDTRQQKFLILTGTGGTGKSTLISLIDSIVGADNISNIPLKDLSQRFSTYGLMFKLLNSCSDLEVSALEDTSTIKKILGEDRIKAEAKGKDAVFFRSYAKLIFSTNQLPLILSEQTNGFYRRLLILEMNRTPAKPDPDFTALLNSQIKALIRYAVAALERMYQNKIITVPNESITAVHNLWKDSDTVIAWLSDECINDPESKLERSYLYGSYCDYCQRNERTHMTRNAFYRSLRNKNYQEKKTTCSRYFMGISIKPVIN